MRIVATTTTTVEVVDDAKEGRFKRPRILDYDKNTSAYAIGVISIVIDKGAHDGVNR